MHRFLLAGVAVLVTTGVALASPVMTTVPTLMRSAPNGHASVVQRIPAHALIDVTGCSKIWCSASWRDIPGFVRSSTVSAADAPPIIYADEPPAPPPPAVVVAPPIIVAPFGCCWGGPYYWHHRY